MSKSIADLLVTLGMDSTQFTRGAKRAVDETNRMQRGISSAATAVKGAMGILAGSLVVDQIVRAAAAGLEYASSLGETAEQLGVSTRALQEYRYAASQAGVEQGEMDQSLAQLNRRIGDAVQGNKPLIATFEKLGINLRNTKGEVIDAGDAIPLIAEALKGVESPAERAAILVDLFGKSGQKLAPLLAGGAAGVNGLRAAAQKLGIVLSSAEIQQADDTADKLSAMKQVLEAKIAGTVARNADSILRLADALAKLADKAIKAADAWARWNNGRGAKEQSHDINQRNRGDRVVAGSGSGLFDILRVGNENTSQRQRTVVRNEAGIVIGGGGTYRVGMPKGGRGGGHGPRPTNAIGGFMATGRDLSRFSSGNGAAGWMTANGVDPDRELASAEAAVRALDAAALAAMKARRAFEPELTGAVGKLSEKMAELRDASQGLLDRLFPEKADVRAFDADMLVLAEAHKRGMLSADGHRIAVERLRREFLGLDAAAVWDREIIDVIDATDGALDEAADRAADVSGVLQDQFDRIGKSAEVQQVRVVESFAEMTNGTLREVDRLVKGIKSGNVLDIVGGLLGALDGIARLATGGKGFNLGPFQFGKTGGAPANTPGFANGGALQLGGMAGVDRNLLSLNGAPLARVSAGETMTITPANDRGGGGGATVVQNYYGPGADEFWGKIAAGNRQAAVQGARGGAQLAMGKLARRQAKALG